MRTELVTTLKRQASEILNRLEKDREPILITKHGVPSAYLIDVETFENLQRRMTLLEGIAPGEKAIEEGRSLTHKQAKRRLLRTREQRPVPQTTGNTNRGRRNAHRSPHSN
jgi:prevent-host-death family protein